MNAKWDWIEIERMGKNYLYCIQTNRENCCGTNPFKFRRWQWIRNMHTFGREGMNLYGKIELLNGLPDCILKWQRVMSYHDERWTDEWGGKLRMARGDRKKRVGCVDVERGRLHLGSTASVFCLICRFFNLDHFSFLPSLFFLALFPSLYFYHISDFERKLLDFYL